ncbi:chemotaxis protein CheD [Thermotoga maritima MSB8]|jgi:chemotaxis protein CheD|uniref:Chemoreceptor glutamine deamidase CheD n=2 Tax=Thermotoga maritima (strain ATCC 43589 / DSM 3109 / JCM 10099 / NBRC 100826 / MSB8) TaxID=243274 RepID=CHED_THEMA|nr:MULTISPECIES: chemoreceptor glutamine deamidase CheD [Thermotoga]Q9X005.1 RecName: Full=Chemoreceptor glutamine deamidase CheD; AltName: Full=Chemoreceptor glutamate methylesterase CheD [Thermotoga maritima MSB8]AAD35984.1 chemotaxis methylation protein [Thermotoga maritima MSB8]AGL49830.1 Chemotaxis protein CheD [Thermotoga maritima MSB8]AHD17344.1 chemotaxis protein CheD [Thermotoga maritima MSB8]AIY85576.1 chemoreceptor glutamine deamidase CheD [Thermotoga sp. 2812B]AKE26816.1 chemotaxi
MKKVIGIGEYAVMKNPGVIVTLGLGSCVAVCMRDPVAKVGAMAHVMLPDSGGKTDKPGKYADTAVKTLVEELKKMGAKVERLEAKIAGGASMFESKGMNIGARNVEAVKKHLKDFGIKLLAEDTGGNRARSVEYNIETGKLLVRKVGGGEQLEIKEI